MATQICASALCFGILTTTVFGEVAPLQVTPPTEMGMSAVGLANIDDLMQRRIDDGEFAGGSVLVLRRGKVVYFKQFGLMDVEAKKPMRSDTIVRIYSMTKPITSVAVMMLVDDGKLSLDDPVEKFLPQLANRLVYDPTGSRPAKSSIKIRDLLRHTSGFVYGNLDGTAVEKQYEVLGIREKKGTLQEFIDQLAGLPLAFDPGTDWHYGVSTDVLGAVIEKVSGRSLNEFFQERVFAPLKMVDTAFDVPAEKLDRFATLYEMKDGKFIVEDDPVIGLYSKKATLYSGGGGLVSTAIDYSQFVKMLAGGGEADGVRLLKSESVSLMTQNQLDEKTGWIDDPGQGFGLGFRVICDPIPDADRRLLGEYGWAGRASTHFFINPREELGVITLEQTLPYSDKTYITVTPLVYDAIVDSVKR